MGSPLLAMSQGQRDLPGPLFRGVVFVLLLSAGDCIFADDPPPAAGQVRIYVEQLRFLQERRAGLVEQAPTLIQQNNALQQYIVSTEFQALVAAERARMTPQFTGLATVSRDKDDSKSSRDSSKSTTTYSVIDNSGQIGSLMLQAQQLLWMSQWNRIALLQNDRLMQALLNDVGDNFQRFRRFSDPMSVRIQAEQLAAIEATTPWIKNDRFNVGALLVRAFALRSLGRLDEALHDLDDASDFPTVAAPIALAAYGHMEYVKGRQVEGRKLLNKAVSFAGRYKADEV